MTGFGTESGGSNPPVSIPDEFGDVKLMEIERFELVIGRVILILIFDGSIVLLITFTLSVTGATGAIGSVRTEVVLVANLFCIN